MMKRILCLAMAVALAFCTVGCGKVVEKSIDNAAENIQEDFEELEKAIKSSVNETTRATTVAETSTVEETTTIEETTTEAVTEQSTTEESTGIGTDLREMLDEYEKMVDKYCDFVVTYDASDYNDIMEALELMEQEQKCLDKLNAMEESREFNDEETKLYTEVIARCSARMLEAAGKIG